MQILFRTLCSLNWGFTWSEIDFRNLVARKGLHLGVRLTFAIWMMCIVAIHNVATRGCSSEMAVSEFN